MHFQEKLAQRRNELIARCATQRRTIRSNSEPLGHVLAAVDSTVSIARRIKQHPGVIVAAIIGIIAIRPHRLAGMLHGGTVALRALRVVAPILGRLRAQQVQQVQA